MAKKQTSTSKKEKNGPKNYRQQRFIIGCILVLIVLKVFVNSMTFVDIL